MNRLFSERHGLSLPRIGEILNTHSISALLGLVSARIDGNWFGRNFPNICPDGTFNAGVDREKLQIAMVGYRLIWPPNYIKGDNEDLSDSDIFDVLEFSYEHIALPRSFGTHPFYNHDHFRYDVDSGRSTFQDDVNRLFERHGLAFEIRDGQITRLAPTGLQEILATTLFATEDEDLNRLLETARSKFFDRLADTRKEGLEKLWDAWERLKTLEPGQGKKEQAAALLDRASTEPVLRQYLEAEALELTRIGNNLMIRHTEVGKPSIASSTQVDYLYHRMFAMIWLLLKSTGRSG